ncbi:MAG: SIS domain-containing protein [Microgenomates group bacterium]
MKIPLLNNRDAMLEIDSRGALASIEQFGDQVQDVWKTANSISPIDVSKFNKIVVAGMGGSILGTHVIQTLFSSELLVPVLIAPDYEVPKYVDENTLVVASSYSGTTAETISATKDAIRKNAHLSGITSGGDISEILSESDAPFLKFETTHNPCGVPRMGLGYAIFGQIALFAKLGFLSVTDEMYREVLESIAYAQLQFSVAVEQDKNAAKLLAYELVDRLPLIIGSEHLDGAAHIFSNQLNENSKQLATYFTTPELNHHLLEALDFPKQSELSTITIALHSDLYHPENTRRLELTEELFHKHSLETRAFTLHSKTKLGQVFELIVFSWYVSYYLAILNSVSPGETSQVEWFKSAL